MVGLYVSFASSVSLLFILFFPYADFFCFSLDTILSLPLFGGISL